MNKELVQSGDTCSATVERGAGHKEGMEMHGSYHVVCHGADGVLKWEDTIERVGRWVEFKGAYKTMDPEYMESVWWAFK